MNQPPTYVDRDNEIRMLAAHIWSHTFTETLKALLGKEQNTDLASKLATQVSDHMVAVFYDRFGDQHDGPHGKPTPRFLRPHKV